MSAVHDEQTKRLATALNDVAVACVVVGSVTPTIAISFDVATAPASQPATAPFVLLWPCAGISIHRIARRTLRSLRP